MLMYALGYLYYITCLRLEAKWITYGSQYLLLFLSHYDAIMRGQPQAILAASQSSL